MSKTLQFVWLDDEPGKQKQFVKHIEAAKISSGLKAHVLAISVNGKDVRVEVENILKRREPDLILLDHVLNRASKSVFETGSSLAPIFRNKWPFCPVVGVSAIESPSTLPMEVSREYVALFPYDDLRTHLESFFSIAAGFLAMKREQPKNVDDFLALMKCPKEDIPLVKTIIPPNIIMGQGEPSPTSIAQWVLHTLIKRQGPLCNREWAATFAGVKPSAFHKIEKIFSPCRYTGIFSSRDDLRWWSSALRRILFKKVFPLTSSLPWIEGRRLPGLTKGDYSRCNKCGEEYPETMAAHDEQSSDVYQMHIKCSEPDTRIGALLGFEQPRIMKDDHGKGN